MKNRKKTNDQSIWTRELIPEDSILRRELIPEDSVWRKELLPADSIWNRDLFARRRSKCLQCPILMVAEEHTCNRYSKIPDDIWDGIAECPIYQ